MKLNCPPQEQKYDLHELKPNLNNSPICIRSNSIVEFLRAVIFAVPCNLSMFLAPSFKGVFENTNS